MWTTLLVVWCRAAWLAAELLPPLQGTHRADLGRPLVPAWLTVGRRTRRTEAMGMTQNMRSDSDAGQPITLEGAQFDRIQHYDRTFRLGLTDTEKSELIEYLRSL